MFGLLFNSDSTIMSIEYMKDSCFNGLSNASIQSVAQKINDGSFNNSAIHIVTGRAVALSKPLLYYYRHFDDYVLALKKNTFRYASLTNINQLFMWAHCCLTNRHRVNTTTQYVSASSFDNDGDTTYSQFSDNESYGTNVSSYDYNKSHEQDSFIDDDDTIINYSEMFSDDEEY